MIIKNLVYQPIDIGNYMVTLLSKEEYLKNKELIPLVKDPWWLCSQNRYDIFASFAYDRSSAVYVYDEYVWVTHGVRPVLKIKHYEHLKPGEKVRIKDLFFTILNDGILLCDTIIDEVIFDKTSNNYSTSYIKAWLENWAQENITLEKFLVSNLQKESKMIIKKKGTIVSFICMSCGCEFDCGIKSIKQSDGNYYCNCPMCGTDCHAEVNDVKSNLTYSWE